MRKNKGNLPQNDISILAVDDDPIITLSLQSYFQAAGYHVDAENNPVTAVERIRAGHYDILLLDFLMMPISGDQVVEQVRRFDQNLVVILLTGHKSMAPPIKTIRELDIQGYYEKNDRFDQLELLVETCVKSILQMRTIQSYQKGLGKILGAMPAIYKNGSTQSMVTAILSALTDLSGTDDCFFALHHNLLRGVVPIGPTYGLYQVASLGQAHRRFDLDHLEAEADALLTEVSATRVINLLTDQAGSIVGMLGAAFSSTPSPQQMELLALYTHQISAAVSTARLNSKLTYKNQELSAAHQKLLENHTDVIRLLRLTVDARDIYTRGHSDRVSFYAYRIARAMGKDEAYCQRVKVAGLFHDIGKLGIPDEILRKPDRLSSEEYTVIMHHPAKGANLLASVSSFQEIAAIVRYHHERYDGTGYPEGLSGTSIPEESRIIAIADSFDAMTSNRHYRTALPLHHAQTELRLGRGTQFDPDMVDAFLSILEDEPLLEQELAWTRTEQPTEVLR